ncbi:hypothetical protein CWI75_09650 [Kineobactrum sediminis]|uniref:Uncharacterized protein n=1 Tax=Kineobactrum sediminis TaxID=1905677 RepID=A0A2N5Y371_9GAMM|nr:LEPR-XLL domain-containing protein [Kineobactrum sediminis]PLW82817.1 hypothetical protein CWI75_09650 [Kineobactrum sediminis]
MNRLPLNSAKRWLELRRQAFSDSPPFEKAPNQMAQAFRLEALEPRLLLSADPVLGELARWVEDNGSDETDTLSAIIQEMNEASQAALMSGAEAGGRSDIPVSWPESWSDTDESPGTEVHALTAEGTPDAEAPADIDQSVADAALAAAKTRFTQLGTGFDAADLTGISITVATTGELAEGVVAQVAGSVITVDANAAGFGWYVDDNYMTDDEFDAPSPGVAGNIDLLSVVMHEIGHVLLGEAHDGTPDTLMSETIAEGERQIAVTFDNTVNAQLANIVGDITLNSVIDAVLGALDGVAPVDGAVSFTTDLGREIVIGETVNDGHDLVLDGVTLSFSELAFDGTAWAGKVVVEATKGELLSNFLSIALEDSDKDADDYAVVGTVVLGTSNLSQLAIDDVDAFTSNSDKLGIPTLLDVDITGVTLSFNDFRGDANDNNLAFTAAVTGLKGVVPASFKDQFNLEFSGSVNVAFELDELEGTDADASALTKALFNDVASSGFTFSASGKLENVGSFSGAVIYESVPDENDPENPIELFALSGNITLGPKIMGKDAAGKDITKNAQFAFAFSELGPLDAFIGSSTDPIAIQGQGYQIKVTGLGVAFNNTIEGRQTDVDFTVGGNAIPAYDENGDGGKGTITLQIPHDHDHNKDGKADQALDFEAGDELRIQKATNAVLNGLWVVTEATAESVTFSLGDTDPGTLIAEVGAQLIRHTIREPEDLTDEGLANGIAPPSDVAAWRDQLVGAVGNQVANYVSWASFSGQFVLGGKADIEFRDKAQEAAETGISPDKLKGNLDVMIDSDLNLLLQGQLNIYNKTLLLPAKLFASLDSIEYGEAAFLLNAELNGGSNLPSDSTNPNSNKFLELNAKIAFSAVDDAFAIEANGRYDLLVPGDITTITLEGAAELVFTPDVSNTAVEIEFSFGAELRETFVGTIGRADGAFTATLSDGALPTIYGAAVLDINLDFLDGYGIEFDAGIEGALLLNTTGLDQTVVIEKRDENFEKTGEELLALTIDDNQILAMALVGNASLDIGDAELLKVDGGYGIEIARDGYSVGIFGDPESDDPEVASVSLLDGLLTGTASGFFAIRGDSDGAGPGLAGIAGRLSISSKTSLKVPFEGSQFEFATLEGSALMVFNTTLKEVTFTPPIEGAVTQTIAAGAPSVTEAQTKLKDVRNPSKISGVPSGGFTNLADIPSDWTSEQAPSAYGVLFLKGSFGAFGDVITADAAGSILVSSDGSFGFSASFYTEADFLDLAGGFVGGYIDLSSNGSFTVDLDAGLSVGPSWLNIYGDAGLDIRYNGDDKLSINGFVGVGIDVDIGVVDVTLSPDPLRVGYDSDSGEISFSVTYPEPFIDKDCWDSPLGEICVYYPNIRDANYDLTVGTLFLFGDGNPPNLGQVDANGVLTLNVGDLAGDRNLEEDNINEIVSIGALTAQSDGAQDLAVTMFGYTQEFKGVTEVRVGAMRDGNDAVYIEKEGKNTKLMVTELSVNFNKGDDVLRNDGAGKVTANGGLGNDLLIGGRGIDILDGGDNADRIQGGAGADELRGGEGDDVITWLSGDGVDTVIDGGGGAADLFEVVGVDGTPLDVVVNANGSDVDLTIAGAGILTPRAFENLNIIGANSPDRIVVNDLTGNNLKRINADFGDDAAQDELIVNTTSGADQVDFNLDTETLDLKIVDPKTGDVSSVVRTVNTTQVEVTNSVTVGLSGAGGSGNDDRVTLNTEGGNDTVAVGGTFEGITTTINSGSGSDTVNINTTAAGSTTVVNTEEGADTIVVGSAGVTDGIDGLVDVNGGDDAAIDELTVNDADSTAGKRADLTAAMVTGLGMASGVSYDGVEELEVRLGSGADTLFVDSTHTGSTDIYAGDGVSQRDDTIAINSISGETTVYGEDGNDAVLVNVEDIGNDGIGNGTGSFVRTFENGIDAVLTIRGQQGSDDVTVNLAGIGEALINVLDGGSSGTDTLTINTTDQADTVLMRKDVVALINNGDTTERVNYNTDINDDNDIEDDKGGLFINTLGGDDKVVSDDNSAVTTIDGGQGNDTFQVGQVFGTPRDGRAGLDDGDRFDTQAIVIGVIQQTSDGEVLFDPTEIQLGDGFTLDEATAKAIKDAANEQYELAPSEALDGVAFVSVGVSYDTTIRGGDDNDVFNVYQNKGELTLEGEDGNDEFVVRAFATLNIDGLGGDFVQAQTSVLAGDGNDTIKYAENAPVDIDGGAGFDTLVVLGTPFGDNFAITDEGVYGAGLAVTYKNLESIELDGLEGDDNFYIRSTSAAVATTVIGGLGNDNFYVAGDIPDDQPIVSKGAEVAESDFATPVQDLSAIKGALILEGGAGPEGASRALQAPLLLPGELNDPSIQIASQTNKGRDQDTVTVYHADNADDESGDLSYRSDVALSDNGLALTGFGMGGEQNFVVGQGEPDQDFGGGITFNGFESLEVLLGTGNETLTISDTGDASSKGDVFSDPEDTADGVPAAEGDISEEDAIDPPMITAIHGGGGADTITVTGRGDGPLVIYGDTSEDGSRYSNGGEGPNDSAASFDNAAGDTIDASGMADPDDGFAGVVIYGGDGDDTITGSQGDDHLAGGRGSDTINGEAGEDHIYGDSQFNIDLAEFRQDQESGDADPATMFEVVDTAIGAADIINAGSGNDVVLGDQGEIKQVEGTRRIETTGAVVSVETTNLASGAGDTIHGDAGNDLLFGGAKGDTVYGDEGSDLIFGDQGKVSIESAANIDLNAIGIEDGAGVSNPAAQFIYTSDISSAADASAAGDTLYGGSLADNDTDTGGNIILGQQGADTIYGGGGDDDIYGGHNVAGGSDTGDRIDAGAGNDVVLGDNGLIERSASATDPRFTVLTGSEIYDDQGNAQVADGNTIGANPDGAVARKIELFDHSNGDNTGKFGSDVIAGGADDDVLFGQLGDDVIHGDGSLSGEGIVALVTDIDGADVGGDDYIEGNGGDDTIYGGLGQDDIVGGSSALYNLNSTDKRPDGADTIYGGNGDATDRNDAGDGSNSRDADVIVGDNGDIYRLVGINGANSSDYLRFQYNTDGRIVVRAVSELDYTPGDGEDSDIGAGDTIRGEAGDDAIFGMSGDDVLFGDSGNDDLIGGVGNDWISGGRGTDGVLGDDGRIYTSRNGTAEPLYAIGVNAEQTISGGKHIESTIYVAGELNKSVNLTPFELGGNDIIYGGLGDDFLHGGAGDDAMSGAEALEAFYDAPINNGDVLAYDPETGEFADYDENAPRTKIEGFLLNFEVADDGKDRLFGDLGNDWLVGGGNSDHLYGGMGDDLLNADDDQDSLGVLNDTPDDDPSAAESYADIAVGGGGRDVLIGNTTTDRLIDWVGEFNSYVVPFSPFGLETISRDARPALVAYLYALSEADGADATRASDTGTNAARNGEPFGEVGIVLQKDDAWRRQSGAPADPQPGNSKR